MIHSVYFLSLLSTTFAWTDLEIKQREIDICAPLRANVACDDAITIADYKIYWTDAFHVANTDEVFGSVLQLYAFACRCD